MTQSSFSDPCDPLSNGFDSGNIFIPMGTTTGFPTWNLTITNTSEPIWFFCKQLVPQAHCNVGMVGAINAPTSGSMAFDAYTSNAEAHQGNSGVSYHLAWRLKWSAWLKKPLASRRFSRRTGRLCIGRTWSTFWGYLRLWTSQPNRHWYYPFVDYQCFLWWGHESYRRFDGAYDVVVALLLIHMRSGACETRSLRGLILSI